MQPENSRGAMQGPEQFPVVPNLGPENAPNLPPLDASIERGQDRYEQAAESSARAVDYGAAPVTPVVNMPATPAQPVVQVEAGQQPAGPIVAADEDLIEKAWVDKAKEIIQQTHGDPRSRSEKVIELRNDYQTKRTASAGNPPIGSQ